jgi:hypothetical protein
MSWINTKLAAAGLIIGLQPAAFTADRQITQGACGHMLTNIGVWSPDGQWIVYDIRSDEAGSLFDGTRIEAVNVETGEVKVLYQSKHDASCGVATWNPCAMKVVFILGPENPAPEWQYSQSHRQGVMVDLSKLGVAMNLDARDLTPPFTTGALRGGSHVHVWDAAGYWVSFTYNDALVESDIRNVGVAIPKQPVQVAKNNSHNHDGECFSVVVTHTLASPRPGSDEIKRACEEAWVGTNGYVRPDGTRQHRALAFQGSVVTTNGETISEVFIADLPEKLTEPGDGPLAGTIDRRPSPPAGITQRRLTFTTNQKYPGLQGPRHWLRSSPDGTQIAFLMKDDHGAVQLWTTSPNGSPPRQVTHNATDIASAFSWSPDGRFIAHIMDNSVCVTEVAAGKTIRLTPRSDDAHAPRPESCVFSPDGKRIAYVRRVATDGQWFNQVFVTDKQP